ncbi:MAG: cation diffusion facilitator family transporter [bacterium]|nr:cation diffusion facilitator family transporter [bacterium]
MNKPKRARTPKIQSANIHVARKRDDAQGKISVGPREISVSKSWIVPKGLVPVLFAICGNLLVTIFKFVGYLLSNSSSLFSEAVHSFADTLNQALLLIGVTLSRKKANAEYAYGYGSERFLWALISACGIFFLGAGVTIYHGIDSFFSEELPELSIITFAILLFALVIESFTLTKAVDELVRGERGVPLYELLREGDPVTIAVVYEDSVAVLGVLIALVGTTLTAWTGDQRFDAVGSIAIGVSLAVVAVLLIKKNREFLIGKSIPVEKRDEIIALLVAEPCIEKVIDFKSTVLDIGRYHLKCEVEWNGSALLNEILGEDDLKEIYREVSGDYEEFKKYVAYTTNRVPRLIGRAIDGIEKKIMAAFPEVKHIDIEIN